MSRGSKIILILVILAAIAGGGYYWFNSVKNDLNAAIKPMMTEIVESNWSIDVIRKNSSPPFVEWMNQSPNNARVFEQFKQLGKLEKYNGVNGFEVKSVDGHELAVASVSLDFSTGPRVFEVRLLKVDGQWRLLGLKV